MIARLAVLDKKEHLGERFVSYSSYHKKLYFCFYANEVVGTSLAVQ